MDAFLEIIRVIFILCVTIIITTAIMFLFATIINTNKKVTEIHHILVQQDSINSSLDNDTINISVNFTK